VNVTLALADFVRAADGKLDLLGAGWTVTGPDPSSFGVGILIEAQPGEFGGQHEILLELVDEDGQLVPVPDGDDPLLRIEGTLEMIPPPGHHPAQALVLPVAFNAANVPLPPGRKLVFRLWIDGETKESWRLPFLTRPEPPAAPS
jgi:hypothetical protein